MKKIILTLCIATSLITYSCKEKDTNDQTQSSSETSPDMSMDTMNSGTGMEKDKQNGNVISEDTGTNKTGSENGTKQPNTGSDSRAKPKK